MVPCVVLPCKRAALACLGCEEVSGPHSRSKTRGVRNARQGATTRPPEKRLVCGRCVSRSSGGGLCRRGLGSWRSPQTWCSGLCPHSSVGERRDMRPHVAPVDVATTSSSMPHSFVPFKMRK